ncbi:MAG: hypothetical protein IT356_04375 [Gemmatimonadaceae bacterium]|nr:hypothetical protein [Gemmatimonadaceae bacterium]
MTGTVAYARALARSQDPATRSTAPVATLGPVLVATGQLREASAVYAPFFARAYAKPSPGSDVYTRLFGLRVALLHGANADSIGKELEAITKLPDWRRLPPVRRPYSLVAAAFALAGLPNWARDVRSAMLAEDSSASSPDSKRFTQPRVDGVIALAERRPKDAIASLRKVVAARAALGVNAGDATAPLARAFDEAGMADSAIAYLELNLKRKAPGQMLSWYTSDNEDPYDLPAIAHKRLAELYDARGDRARAIQHYSSFVALWSHADPDLQPMVTAARKRLAYLRRKEG